MIHCVRFAEIESHLERLGFALVRRVGQNRYYAHGTRVFTIREPNVDGNLPEIIANGAFDAAGLRPPDWRVFWCD